MTPEQIIAAVAAHGSIRAAAPSLGIDERTVRRRIAELGIEDAVTAARGTGVDPEPVTAEVIEAIDARRLALAAKDAELRTLRREHKQLSEHLGKLSEVVARIVDESRIPVETPSYTVAPPNDTLPERSIILPIYDLQFGQLVRPEDVPFGKGAYSEAIFLQRLSAYVSKVTAFLRDRAAATNFTELHIVLGGDLVEGDGIFRGQAWQLEMPPTRQVLKLRIHLYEALRTIIGFAKETLGVESIALYCVPGNHGKVGGKMSGATPSDYNWDHMLGELVIDMLREEPVDLAVNDSAGAILFETQGATFLTVHGHEGIKGHAGIPFYGFARFDARVMRLSEVIFDYCLSGHIHQPATIPNGSGGEFIISGDWVGGNNLSGAIVAASRPQQRVLLVGRKYGVATDERIYFDDRSQRVRPTIYRAA